MSPQWLHKALVFKILCGCARRTVANTQEHLLASQSTRRQLCGHCSCILDDFCNVLGSRWVSTPPETPCELTTVFDRSIPVFSASCCKMQVTRQRGLLLQNRLFLFWRFSTELHSPRVIRIGSLVKLESWCKRDWTFFKIGKDQLFLYGSIELQCTKLTVVWLSLCPWVRLDYKRADHHFRTEFVCCLVELLQKHETLVSFFTWSFSSKTSYLFSRTFCLTSSFERLSILKLMSPNQKTQLQEQ